MARGFFAGLIWGAVVAVLGLGAASLLAPPVVVQQAENPRQANFSIAPGSEFNRNRPDAPPMIPGSGSTKSAGGAPVVAAASPENAPRPDTTPAGAPATPAEAPAQMSAPQTGQDPQLADPATQGADNGLSFVLAPGLGTPQPATESVPTPPPLPDAALRAAAEVPATEPEQPAPPADAPMTPDVQIPAEGAAQPASPAEATRTELVPRAGTPTSAAPAESAGSDAAPAATASRAQTVAPVPPGTAISPPDEPEAVASVPTPTASGGIVLSLGELPSTQVPAAAHSDTPAPVVVTGSEAPQQPSPSIVVGTEVPQTPAPAETPGPAASVPVIRGTDAGSETAPAAGSDVAVLAPGGEAPAPSIRLPRIGDDSAATSAPASPAGAGAPERAPTQPSAADSGIRLGALSRNAQPFAPEAGLPLLSVILIDTGETGVGADALQTFTFPVTIAVSPEDPDAAANAAAYRAAGAEVLVLAPPVKLGTSSTDLRARLLGYADALPLAVGLVDAEEGGFQENRLLIDGAIEALSEEGAGLVVYDRRFNNAQKAAVAAGLPVALIASVLDADGRSTAGIERMLDRAAQTAGQQGATLVIGHSYPETVNALFAWVQNQLAPTVQLAPVSALLRR